MTYKELEKLQEKNNKKVCIYGAGNIGKTWGYDIIFSAGFQIDSYFDSKLGADIEIRDGVKTIDFDMLCNRKEDIIVVIAVSEKYHSEIIQRLEENNIINYVVFGFRFLQEFCESVLESKDSNIIQKYKKLVDDKEYLKVQFKYKFGYELDFENPKTFNEKLQWLKVYDRNPEYTKLVDKYEFKEFIKKELGEKYLIPTIGIWDSVEDINWDKLPNQFVLKCTHDSGSVIICKNKDEFNIKQAKAKLENALQRNYYWLYREWPYKNVIPRIIAEPYLQNKKTDKSLDVYKFFNFGQEQKLIQVIQNDKQEDETIDYFDINWNLLEIKQNYPNSSTPLSSPSVLSEMLQVAKRISKIIPSVRTDFYVVNNKLYVSEITFYSDAGLQPFYPECWDSILGQWLTIPRK